MKYMIIVLIIVWLLAACMPAVIAEPTQTTTLMPTLAPTASPVATLTEPPTVTSDLIHLDSSAILFEQNFETGKPDGLSILNGDWKITSDNTGNHFYCNIPGEDYSLIQFGSDSWTNYAVEMRIMSIEQKQQPRIQIYSRINSSTQGYYGTVSFQYQEADLGFTDPPSSVGPKGTPAIVNTWYLMRLEAFGNQIKLYIDNQLIAEETSTQRTSGKAGFNISPNATACFDDIRAWALMETGAVGTVPIHVSLSPELVTDKAATGDGGNAWGGHQARIVRTQDGVFTAYTVDGSGYLDKKWQLAWRREDGTWPVVAQGDAGKDPVNLLASPDGTLHVIGWPGGLGTMWSGKPNGNQITMTEERIPGVAQGDWPYNSAGMDGNGDLCVLSSTGGETAGGAFQWACWSPSTGQWISHTTQLDYRYCYTYVFPGPGGQVALVSTRDVRWGALRYPQPAGAFDYVFNALGYWRTQNLSRNPLQQVGFLEEKPAAGFDNVGLDAQQDAYLDTQGNMHIIYRVQGASTQGASISRQVIFSPDGKVVNDVRLPDTLGDYARIFQDAAGRFYLLGSAAILYPAGNDGMTLGTPVVLNLGSYVVEYSGFGISVPRTGTRLSNVMDIVFPSGNGSQWIYFQLPLQGN